MTQKGTQLKGDQIQQLEQGIENIEKAKCVNGCYRVFVYGSLKVGKGNHRLLNMPPIYDEAFTIREQFKMISLGGFPGVIAGSSKIHGEFYIVNAETLGKLHALEGHPSFYQAIVTLVQTGKNQVNYCLMYILSKSGYNNHPIVETGKW
jgi:gamma-glutamylcyclotransferase (GGCT)/AIG2-like uncharacterized protein YtfP